MTTVNQLGARPTNKLMMGATASSVLAVYLGPAVSEVWAETMADAYPHLTGPGMLSLIEAMTGGFAGLVAGYYAVKDRPNVVVADK